MGAGHVPHGVNHGHHREPGGECEPGMPERTALRVDHHGARAPEDEHERADELGRERAPDGHVVQQQPAVAAGCSTGSPLAAGALVLTAFTIAPRTPSAT